MTEHEIQGKLRYFRNVKALTTMLRAESFLREYIMLGSNLGMFAEGAIAHEKAKESLAEASAYLNGGKDEELRKGIAVESSAVAGGSAEYALAVPGEEVPK